MKQRFYILLGVILLITALYISYHSYFKQPNPLVNKDIFQYLEPFQKGIVTSTVLSMSSKDTITLLDTKGGIVPRTKVPYIVHLQTAMAGNKKENLYFTVKTLADTTILIPQGKGYKSGTFADLHTGDTILLEKDMAFDLIGKNRSPKIKHIKITKIN